MARLLIVLLALPVLLASLLCVPSDAADVRWIDTHVHFEANADGAEVSGATEQALRLMDEMGIAMSLFEPAPAGIGRRDTRDYPAFVSAIRAHPKRFAFLGGGGLLNGFLQAVAARGASTDADRAEFVRMAMGIADSGAVGFGEIACAHLTLSSAHPFEECPPDHPLMLALADVAASRNMVVDIHMEAVLNDMPLPPRYSSPPNAPTLRANVRGFQNLLAHNRGARIVWAHAGWDNTGQRTAQLCRGLIECNSNLYMSLKLNNNAAYGMMSEGRPSDDWLALLRDHPDRFVIGSDAVYTSGGIQGSRHRQLQRLMGLLPPAVARQITWDNPIRIYRLSPGTAAAPLSTPAW